MGLLNLFTKKSEPIEELKDISKSLDDYIQRLENATKSFQQGQEQVKEPLPNHIAELLERKESFFNQANSLFEKITALQE